MSLGADVEERLAESVTLRGAKRGGHPLRADEAAQALDAALLQEGESLSVMHDWCFPCVQLYI